ncbi:hypothetical protein TeGR_g1728 [Tetraparma gracilis]|uniref:FAD dependent oxidoreductase domain-containing protein n=1 Tax=Tetraparma gracilis TaxID=2962635 RepID=A0ABQ6N788_9STRA|nr:hypothetical protein TeGR_g1728 [Tetraparma gracilis]
MSAPPSAPPPPCVILLDIDGVLLPHDALLSQVCAACSSPHSPSLRFASAAAEADPYPLCADCAKAGAVPCAEPGRFPRRCLQALEHLVSSLPAARVVLSSTWRCDASAVRHIEREFGEFGGSLSGVSLDCVTDPARHSTRGEELRRWLSPDPVYNPFPASPPLNFVVLDDDDSVAEPCAALAGRVVHVDSQRGLTMKQARAALRILSPPPPPPPPPHPPHPHHPTVVIGSGPIGCSIAASLPPPVLLLSSPSAPTSSGDSTRIARCADAEGSEEWTRRNKRSLQLFGALEQKSKVSFFTKSGSLVAGSPAFLAPIAKALESQACAAERLSPADLKSRFPYLSLPPLHRGLYEPDAGHVDPRLLAEACAKIVTGAGGAVVAGHVTSITAAGEHPLVTYSCEPPSGPPAVLSLTCDRLVVAAGGFTGPLLSSLPPPCPFPPYRLSKRTIAYLPIAAPPPGFPCIKLQLPSPPPAAGNVHDVVESGSVYILPPHRYAPGGPRLLKIGGGPNDWLPGDPRVPGGAWEAELASFMSGPGDPAVLAALASGLREAFPRLELGEAEGRPCFTSCSKSDRVEIREVGPGITAVGICQGKSAGAGPGIGEEVREHLEKLSALKT